MNRPRRTRSPPPFGGCDPRVMARGEPPPSRPPLDYDDPFNATLFEPQMGPGMPFGAESQYPVSYRDYRLPPAAYRAPPGVRETSYPVTTSSPYKILCITNMNQKVGDGPVREALLQDFSRFGDISVSICHDSGERLAYIYFRTYEEAREARHAKTRSILFDRPIEIEPIFEPRGSPVDSPPPTHPASAHAPPQPMHQPQPPIYHRQRSMTPPDYYSMEAESLPARRPPIPLSSQRGQSPPPNYTHPARYPSGASPPIPMSYGRYYIPPAQPYPNSPFSSPPHDPYRSPYHGHMPPHPNSITPAGPYHSPYGPPMVERERVMNDGHMTRSPRNDPYYPIDQRGYIPHPSTAPPMHQHSSRGSSSGHHSHLANMSPPVQQHRSPYPEPVRYMSREFRREKYGGERYTNEPDEGRPSRVLLITNVDSAQTEADFRVTFSPYGVIEDVEIRKIGPDISTALIKYSSMDGAYKAKTALNGKYFGSLKCRISYGKVSASRRLWIGGLGQTTTKACLEDEFGRFGEIISLDYISGRPYAYVEFESANQAQFATHFLKGTLAAEAERRIRIEYVDPVERVEYSSKNDQASEVGSKSRPTNDVWASNNLDSSPHNSHKRSLTPTETTNPTKRVATVPDEVTMNNHRSTEFSTKNSPESKPTRRDEELNNNQSNEDSNHEANIIESQHHPAYQFENPEGFDVDRMALSRSISDMLECCPVSWDGQLVLRNFKFPSKMIMCSGRKSNINSHLSRLNGDNGERCPVLRITQRWRLHPQPKLEEVKRRMQSGNLGMLLITSRSDHDPSSQLLSPNCKTPQSSSSQVTKQNGDQENPVDDTSGPGETKTTETSTSSSITADCNATQSRPLKNLISYLEQKDAAGVVSLNPDQNDGSKLLYTFPPGEFALELLRRKAPHLNDEVVKEEFLLGVIVGGGEAKI